MRDRLPVGRTSFAVRREADGWSESIAGERRAWRFRPHFHAGDEIVQLLAGRALLRLPWGCREVVVGEQVVVPAGVVHRFEALDAQGWAFASRFAAPAAMDAPTNHAAHDTLGSRARHLLAALPSLRSDIEAIADDCAVSAGHLSRAFRRETGSSLHNFHVLLALQRAKAALRAGAPIATAALDAGFYDQAHLNREFVKTLGMTPAAFRRGWAVAA